MRVSGVVVGMFFTLAFAQAGPTEAGQTEECPGGSLHHSHTLLNAPCMNTHNPHYQHLADDADCYLGVSGNKRCNGCFACCNHWYDATDICICPDSGPGAAFCNAANNSSRNQCRISCETAWKRGCTNPNEWIDPGE